jgi:uncharacterized protein (TIGR04222 family)
MGALNAIFPFSLNGPQFLGFFVACFVVLFLGLRLVTRMVEAGAAPKMTVGDPYQIAYLRGGAAEALRVAAFSLVDRGLLRFDGIQAVAAGDAAARIANHPVERWLMNHFDSRKGAESLDTASLTDRVDAHYQPKLERLHLLPDEAGRRFRLIGKMAVVAALLGLAGVRVAQTLAAGRINLGFLAVLLAIALWLVYRKGHPRLTARGRTVMRDLRSLFAALHRRAAQLRPGGKKTDAVMVAAIFGVGVLPSAAFALSQRLWPQPQSSSSSGGCGSSGCGSSGGSCGGGGGGGCGGGGCGS